jgi:hypothetical protein
LSDFRIKTVSIAKVDIDFAENVFYKSAESALYLISYGGFAGEGF